MKKKAPSKKMAPSKVQKVEMPIDLSNAQQQQMQQAPQMQMPIKFTNAQQQQMKGAHFEVPAQLTNAQQQQMQAPQMQMPQMQQSNPYSNAVFTPQQQVPIMRQQNVRGGYYGGGRGQSNYSEQVFNDDEPIMEKVKQ